METWDSVDISSSDRHLLENEDMKESHAHTMPNEKNIYSVRDPRQQGEGMHAYMTYKIIILTKERTAPIERRFSEFVWLHDQLCLEFPGLIIPPLPEKVVVGRFELKVIETRQRALELFLNRIEKHIELKTSCNMKAFMEPDTTGLGLDEIKSQLHDGGKKHASATGLFQWFDETYQQISSTLGSGTNIEKTKEDLKFEEIQMYIDGIEPILIELQKHAHGLTKGCRDMADGLFDFGVAFTLLGQSEGDGLSSGLGHVGNASDKLSVLAAEQAEKELLYFEEPIMDYVRMIYAVKGALQKRLDAKLTFQTALADLESKKATREKCSGGYAKGGEKFKNAQLEEEKAQARVDAVKQEYDTVTDRVFREVEVFKVNKLADFKRIIVDYIHCQIEYNQKIEEEWAQIIPQLKEIQLADSQADPIGLSSLEEVVEGAPFIPRGLPDTV